MFGRGLLPRILPPLLAFLTGIIFLELSVRLLHIRAFLVPPPSQVCKTFVTDAPELWVGLVETAKATVLGFGLSSLVGTTIAVLLSTSRWTERAFFPYAIFFQTIPIVGIAPLLVIWLGYGMP